MTPEESLIYIDGAPQEPATVNILSNKAFKEFGVLITMVATLGYAFVEIDFIERKLQGYTVISVFVFFVLFHLLLLFFVLIKKVHSRYVDVKPTIHLDRDSAEHTLDTHFKQFIPDGDILMLQTWFPENKDDTKGLANTARIDRWQGYLQKSIKDNQRQAERMIRLRVLLLGSEDVLRNRIRYRWDIAQQVNGPYPLKGKFLEDAVKQTKDRIDKTHMAFLLMEKKLNDFLQAEGIDTRIRVSIRYYRIAPYGPLYIFGNQALLTGFYDHRWTSDRAPAIRLNAPKTAEWMYFWTQFECIWSLREPGEAEGSTTVDNAHTDFTSRAPSWRTLRPWSP